MIKGYQGENLTLQEQLARIFENIALKINAFEILYENQKFEEGYQKVVETIDLCERLSFIFLDNELTEVYDWKEYFISLIETIFRLANSHNPILKEKLIKSLYSMAALWRKNSQHKKALDTTSLSFNMET